MTNPSSEGDNQQPVHERATALNKLAQQLENSVPPQLVLTSVCKFLLHELSATQVVISLRRVDREEFEPVSQYRIDDIPGNISLRQHTWPITHRGETIGQLSIACDASKPSITSEENQLLGDIAHRTGTAAHVMRITRDLQHARERLVLAREEERKKLRRNLHDAVGPTLTATMLKMGALRDRVQQDKFAEAMVSDLEEVPMMLRR